MKGGRGLTNVAAAGLRGVMVSVPAHSARVLVREEGRVAGWERLRKSAVGRNWIGKSKVVVRLAGSRCCIASSPEAVDGQMQASGGRVEGDGWMQVSAGVGRGGGCERVMEIAMLGLECRDGMDGSNRWC